MDPLKVSWNQGDECGSGSSEKEPPARSSTIYTVVSSNLVGMLTQDVNQHIKEGWKPIGGPTSFQGQLMQAMIKEDE